MAKNLSVSVLLDFYGGLLTDKQKEALELYYNQDFSLAEIAEKFEISRQGVRSVLKKGETILIDMEEKLHLASRFSKVLKKSAEIANELENINQNINNNDISSRIHSLINEIKEMAEY